MPVENEIENIKKRHTDTNVKKKNIVEFGLIYISIVFVFEKNKISDCFKGNVCITVVGLGM